MRVTGDENNLSALVKVAQPHTPHAKLTTSIGNNNVVASSHQLCPLLLHLLLGPGKKGKLIVQFWSTDDD